jgi:soluble lytic murein transglycosylase-like protein
MHKTLLLFCSVISISLSLTPPSLYAAIEPAPSDQPKAVNYYQESISKLYHSKPAKQLKTAYELLQKENFSEAIRIASKLQNNKTFSDYALWISATAHRLQAVALIEKKQFKAAIAPLRKAISLQLSLENKSPYSPLIKTVPKEIALNELLLGKAFWATQQSKLSTQSFEHAFQRLLGQNSLLQIQPQFAGQYAEVCQKTKSLLCTSWLLKLISTFPKKSEHIKLITAQMPSILEKAKFAKPQFSKVTQTYKSPDQDQVAFDAAMGLLFEEKYSDAIRSFRLFLDNFPRSTHRFRVKYWLAKSLKHENEDEKAQKIFEELQQGSPFGYYGLLASNELGKPLDAQIRPALPVATDTDPALLPAEVFRLKRAQSLVTEKAYALAAIELKELSPRDAFSNSFMIYLAMLNYEAKNYRMGFRFVSDLLLRGYDGILSPFGSQMIFPIDYFETIKKKASEQSIDPILILSLIKQESAFDGDANSSVGAMGLMQLMPATAYDTDPTFSTSDMLIADNNIQTGTKYLKKLMTKFNGNIVLSLAAYNAGPTAVDRWLKDIPPKRNMLEFIESIPYRETRDYVGSIIRNYYWYSQKLSGYWPKTVDYFWGGAGLSTPQPDPVKPQNESALRRRRAQHTLYLPTVKNPRRE